VDDQLMITVIIANSKTYLTSVRLRVTALHQPSRAVHVLVDDGLALPQFPARHTQNQVAILIHADLFGAFKRQFDRLRIGVRRYDEVILELSLRAVVDQVHAGIDAFIPRLAEIPNAGTPTPRIAIENVVALASRLFQSGPTRRAVGAFQSHSQPSAFILS